MCSGGVEAPMQLYYSETWMDVIPIQCNISPLAKLGHGQQKITVQKFDVLFLS